MSAAGSRAEAEAEASARVKESERRLLARLQSVEEQVDNKVREGSASDRKDEAGSRHIPVFEN